MSGLYCWDYTAKWMSVPNACPVRDRTPATPHCGFAKSAKYNKQLKGEYLPQRAFIHFSDLCNQSSIANFHVPTVTQNPSPLDSNFAARSRTLSNSATASQGPNSAGPQAAFFLALPGSSKSWILLECPGFLVLACLKAEERFFRILQ